MKSPREKKSSILLIQLPGQAGFRHGGRTFPTVEEAVRIIEGEMGRKISLRIIEVSYVSTRADLIDAEAKMGEMLDAIEPKREKESSSQRTSLPSPPSGITKKESHEAQTLYRNPEIRERVKTEAREIAEDVLTEIMLKAYAGPEATA